VAFLRRDADEAAELHAELEAARQRSEELAALKRELAERVASVRERERELERALTAGGAARPGDDRLASRLEELERRERSVAAREKALAEKPVLPPAPDEDERLAARERALAARADELDRQAQRLVERERLVEEREQAAAEVLAEPDRQQRRLAEIEARLAELREAEKIFLKTQQELAARSEAVAARERLVAEREREVNGGEDGHAGLALSELEARLRRLERQQTDTETTRTFSGGLSRLSREGSRRPPAPPG
jgi:hypothetical protein